MNDIPEQLSIPLGAFFGVREHQDGSIHISLKWNVQNQEIGIRWPSG